MVELSESGGHEQAHPEASGEKPSPCCWGTPKHFLPRSNGCTPKYTFKLLEKNFGASVYLGAGVNIWEVVENMGSWYRRRGVLHPGLVGGPWGMWCGRVWGPLYHPAELEDPSPHTHPSLTCCIS